MARANHDMLAMAGLPFTRRCVCPDSHVPPILWSPHVNAIRLLRLVSQHVVDIGGDASCNVEDGRGNFSAHPAADVFFESPVKTTIAGSPL